MIALEARKLAEEARSVDSLIRKAAVNGEFNVRINLPTKKEAQQERDRLQALDFVVELFPQHRIKDEPNREYTIWVHW